MCVCGWKWKWSGGARDDYASVNSHWKWAPQKRPVVAHIKARSKHSLESETAWHLLQGKQKKIQTQSSEASQTKLFTCACRMSEIKGFDQREFFSFSFVVELCGKLVNLMTTYQILISNYGKNFIPSCREKITRSQMAGIFLFRFHYEAIVSQYSTTQAISMQAT